MHLTCLVSAFSSAGGGRKKGEQSRRKGKKGGEGGKRDARGLFYHFSSAQQGEKGEIILLWGGKEKENINSLLV